MASQIDLRIVEMWRKRKDQAQELRQLYETRWQDAWQWYRNTKETDRLQGQYWMQNKILPDAYRIIETLIPQHILGMFRTPQWFSVEATSVAGESYQRMVKGLLLQGWRKADGYKKSILGVKYGNILGHFVAKTYWDVQIGEREVQDLAFEVDAEGETISPRYIRTTREEVRHSGPQIDMPDLFHLWQDPTGREMWWIELIPESMAWLTHLNKQFAPEGRLYRNLSEVDVPDSAQTSGYSRWGSAENPSLEDTVEGISTGLRRTEDNVDLWQCSGWVPPDVVKYGETRDPSTGTLIPPTQWRLHTIANGKILIRDTPCPTPDRRPFYTNVPAIPIPHSIYGDTVLSYIGPLIDRRSTLENWRMDEIQLNMFPTTLISEEANFGPNDLLKMPGGVKFLQTAPNTRVQDYFAILPRAPVLAEVFQESAIKEQQILVTSGATEPYQGTSFGGRTTATEAQLIASAGSGRFALATMWLDEVFKKDVLRRMFELYQVKLTQPQVVEMAEDPSFRDEISFSDLKYDVDISVDSGLLGSLDQMAVQNISQMLSVFVANPETAVYLKSGPLIKDLMFRMGMPNAAKYVRTDDEVAQIQAQAQQQRLLEAAMSGKPGESAAVGG